MRVAICFLAMMVGCVVCTMCPNSDLSLCTGTTCAAGYTLACNHNHECVCVSGAAGGMCTSLADCAGHRCDHGGHGNDVAHCVDGHCHCGRGGGGNGGK